MNTGEYERMYRMEDSYWWFVGRHRMMEALLRERYGRPAPGSLPLQILDIGCGTGAMSARLAPWGQVVSADFSPLALQFSRRRGLHHLVGADAMHLPLASDRFDLIVAMDILEHLPDDGAALCECFRVLKPGGRMMATVPAYPHLWSEHDVALMHYRRYRRSEYRSRFAAAGFRIEKLSHTMMLLYPLAATLRRLHAGRPPHDPPRADMPAVPAPINYALTLLLDVGKRLRSPPELSHRIDLTLHRAKALTYLLPVLWPGASGDGPGVESTRLAPGVENPRQDKTGVLRTRCNHSRRWEPLRNIRTRNGRP